MFETRKRCWLKRDASCATAGRLTILVPYHGPTIWLDGANWHRYLHDLRGSETLLPELSESGWRRRYRKSDLEALVTGSGFAMASLDQRGTGLSELGWFIGRLLERSGRLNRDAVRIWTSFGFATPLARSTGACNSGRWGRG